MAGKGRRKMQETNSQPEMTAAEQEKAFSEQAKVRRDKLAALKEAGQDPYTVTRYDVANHCGEIRENFDAMEGQHVTVAGRMMQKRVMGKASFCNVQDETGRMQVYVKREKRESQNSIRSSG